MIARIIYEIRWWFWLMSAPSWPMWMYTGFYDLDKASRKIVLDRLDAEWLAREPKFRGKYPHRRIG